MTVDSAYLGPQWSDEDGEVCYPFEIESIGDAAIQVWMVEADGTRTQLVEFTG